MPLIVFPKGSAHYALEMLRDSAYDVISVDWTVDPTAARTAVGDGKTLQGNLDPSMLFADEASNFLFPLL